MDFTKTLEFLSKLSKNNNREWFNEHKSEFNSIKGGFEEYIQTLITKINEIDPSIGPIKAKDCVFRIYRDIRFSKNKEPYKTHFGAYIASGGRKSKTCGYYLHIDPAQSFFAAGAYAPESLILKEIRYEIMDRIDDFKNIIENKAFKRYFPELTGEKLKTAPKGFPKDFKEIELIKLKSYEVFHVLEEELLTSGKLDNYLISLVKMVLPYNQFFNKVIRFVLAENNT